MKNQILIDALEYIANPIPHIQEGAKKEGSQVNGSQALLLSTDPFHLQEKAKQALERFFKEEQP